MKDKLTKAYTAAWRWPEMYSDSPSMIWTSRIIAFLIPATLVVLAFVTGIPLLGWIGAIFVAVAIAGVLGLTTVAMFYPEFDSVEDFQTREARIKEFFHGFPAITDVPVIENTPDEWIAYGHVEPQAFICAIKSIIRAVTDDEALVDGYRGLEDSVGHLSARFINPQESHWDEGLEICKNTTEGCFDITRITKVKEKS